MRTSPRDRLITCLLAGILITGVMLPERDLMADKPTFSIDNSFTREQEYFPGDWNITDTYLQNYSLQWSEIFSSRLELELTFEVEAEDIIRSLDVDEKNIIPSLELEVLSTVWDLNFLAEDTIEYSNEFNTPRRDALEFGLDFNFLPFYLPPLRTKVQRLIDTQDFLEDKVQRKFEASTDYTFGTFFDLGLAWREEDIDDRLFDNSDTVSHSWDASFNYNQVITPVLKFDYKALLNGGRTDTLNNAGTVIGVERTDKYENGFKLTLDTFPAVHSDLEYTFVREPEEPNSEDTFLWLIEAEQPVLDLGTFTERMEFERNRVAEETERTLEHTLEVGAELSGAPYRYGSYSLAYNVTFSELEDTLAPNNSADNKNDEANISVTVTPAEKVLIETSYNWSVAKTDGRRTDSVRTFKIDSTIEGEVFHIPNLTFRPLIEVSDERNIAENTDTKVRNAELAFTYTPYLTENVDLQAETIFKWKKEDDQLNREIEFNAEFGVDFASSTWKVAIEDNATATVFVDGVDPTTWSHDASFKASRQLTGRFSFDFSYRYNFEGDDQDTDELEANLEWRGDSASWSLATTNERTFEGIKEVLRTYEAVFSMSF